MHNPCRLTVDKRGGVGDWFSGLAVRALSSCEYKLRFPTHLRSPMLLTVFIT